MIQNPERHARILRHTPPPPPSSLTWDPAGREREGEGLDTLCAKGGGHVHVVAGGWRSRGYRRRWWSRRRRAGRLEEGEGVNDPDSRDRTCVSPRTTDYEWATLWRSRSTELMHVKGGCGQKERRGEDARVCVCVIDREHERRREHRLRGFPEWRG